MSIRDTTREAEAVRTALYRQMSGSRRCDIAVEMSLSARSIAMAGIRNRHPEYGEHEVRFALFRLLVGDELFRRAWPRAPLIEP